MNLFTLYGLNNSLQQALQAQKLERVTSILRDMQDEIINIQMREAKEDMKRRIREEIARRETA